MRKFLLFGMLLAALAVPDDAVSDQWTVSQVSTGPSGGNGGDWTNLLDVTRDGSRILFATTERLTPDDTDSTMDLYVRSGSTTTLMSPNFSSGAGNISDDGSTLVFQTPDRLVAEDTDSAVDLYKRVGANTTLLSIGPNGEHGPCQVSDFTSCNTFRAMSDDGQHVFFVSNGHLAPGDDEPTPCQQDPENGTPVQTYACQDIYENWNGVTRLVSGGPADPRGPSDYELTYYPYSPRSGSYSDLTFASRDGTKAFFQAQDPLLPADTDAVSDVYEWSDGGTLSLASPEATGGVGIRGMSDDGNHLFYWNGFRIWDHTAAGDVARTPSLGFGDYEGNSGDGSHLYFSVQEGLVPADTDGQYDLYDESGGGVKLLTRGDTPSSPASGFDFLSASRDGSKVYLDTEEPLVPYDEDGNDEDIYLVDSATGSKRIVSTGPADLSGLGTSTWIGTSEDGSRALFETSYGLVHNDSNISLDIYEWNGDTSITTLTPDWTGGLGCCGHTFTNERFVNDAGTRVAFITDRRLRASDTDSAQDVYETVLTTAEPPGDPGFYAKPAGASPVRVSLVPTFQPCPTPNRRHGSPVTFGSCAPPTLPASYATVDTGGQGNSVGFVRMDVVPGGPQYGDQADVKLYLLLGNVSWRANRLDYDGRVRATAVLRLTDRTVAGTMEDVPWSFDAPCYQSDFDPVGSTCELGTSADAVMPGVIPEGARAIWQLGPIQIQDGGADGAPTTNPSDNRTFSVQGVFVP